MKAVVHDRYGPPDVQHVEDVTRPVPGAGEVLVKVHSTTVNRTDCGVRGADPFFVRVFTGLRRPKQRILGSEFAGDVEAVGPGVTELDVGDRVFGVVNDGMGAHAEYVCVRQDAPIATMPEGLSYDEAAAIPDGAILALSCLRGADIEPGQRIVVYGASGSIGSAAVQLAKHLGTHVTAVCNTENVEVVRSLGPDVVVDYTKEDFTENGERYDIVFDAVGKHSYRRCRDSLVDGGVFAVTDLGPGWQNPLLVPATKWFGRTTVRFPLPHYTKENLLYVKDLVERGELRAVIDRRYPLDEIVEATRYVETGQKTGNVVVTVLGEP